MSDPENSGYGLSRAKAASQIPPPFVDYLPRKPRNYDPGIALIGAGGISEYHLRNYREMGLRVVAIADRNPEKAERRKQEFYPKADITSDYRALLGRNDIEVIDATPHPLDRVPIVEDALRAGKHVLSQKPFVSDLRAGRRLIDLANDLGLKLAVNQNGRWAPHFSYLRNAVASGLIGDVVSMDFTAQWDQTWIKGSPGFESLRHMVLCDFAIHWFDLVNCLMNGQPADSLYASTRSFPQQIYRPPSLAAAVINYPHAQARLAFNAHTQFGEEDASTIVGTRGTIRSRGPGLNNQPCIEIFLEEGSASVPLSGDWFSNGFQGTMGELLCSIEEHREPSNSAKSCLGGLELCFAALLSADSGQTVFPGSLQ